VHFEAQTLAFAKSRRATRARAECCSSSQTAASGLVIETPAISRRGHSRVATLLCQRQLSAGRGEVQRGSVSGVAAPLSAFASPGDAAIPFFVRSDTFRRTTVIGGPPRMGGHLSARATERAVRGCWVQGRHGSASALSRGVAMPGRPGGVLHGGEAAGRRSPLTDHACPSGPRGFPARAGTRN
jgi:hypothetical protein